MTSHPFTVSRYEEVLRAGTSAGYRFISFIEASKSENDSRLCLLRHDCDNDLEAARRMATVEAGLGVRSTWFVMLRSAMYNALSLPSRALIAEILEQGHWLGLHFDERCLPGNSPAGLVCAAVEQERNLLATEFDTDVAVVSFHQPSQRVLNRQLKLSCLNTYEPRDAPGFEYYSDSNMRFREGCPSALFRNRRWQHVQLLIHPEWWTERPCDIPEKWREMLCNNFFLIERTLAAREDAYEIRHSLSLTPLDKSAPRD